MVLEHSCGGYEDGAGSRLTDPRGEDYQAVAGYTTQRSMKDLWDRCCTWQLVTEPPCNFPGFVTAPCSTEGLRLRRRVPSRVHASGRYRGYERPLMRQQGQPYDGCNHLRHPAAGSKNQAFLPGLVSRCLSCAPLRKGWSQ